MRSRDSGEERRRAPCAGQRDRPQMPLLQRSACLRRANRASAATRRTGPCRRVRRAASGSRSVPCRRVPGPSQGSLAPDQIHRKRQPISSRGELGPRLLHGMPCRGSCRLPACIAHHFRVDQPRPTMNPAVFVHKQLSYFIGTDEDRPIHLFRAPVSPMFDHERAQIILRRMEVLAWVFMLLVPLWILIDIQIFPVEVIRQLVFGRLLATLCLGLLLVVSLVLVERASWLVSYLSLLFLMAIPAIFELYAQPVFSAWLLRDPHVSETQTAAMFLYRQLPIIYISGLALFPLTLLESLPIAIAITVIDAIVDMKGLNLGALHATHWAGLWVVFVTGGTAILAGVLQFNLFLQNHRLEDFDADSGLMKRHAAQELLKLLWSDKTPKGQRIGIGMMALPAPPVDTTDSQAEARWLSNEAEFLRLHLLPGMYGIRWSSQCLGLVSVGHARQEIEGMMNAIYGKTANPTGSHNNRTIAIAERTADSGVGPQNLLSIAEQKLRRALAKA
ncbi:MAG: hypothetical protein KGJ97_06490 [Xanthomonadaceae bacterium]|nr:hypothetical protein [Xanthomonadaceae bacterium]